MERETTLKILNNVTRNKAFSNISINEEIKKAGNEDGAFIRYIVYGVLENRIYLDYFISQFVESPIEKVRINSLNILRIAVYQILYMDSVPDYAAVNEAVELAKKTSKGQAPFVNGVLRNVLRQRDKVKLPDAKKYPIKRLSVKYSCEEWMIKYLIRGYGMDFAKKFIIASNEIPPLSIRVNTLKTTPELLSEKLSEAGFNVKHGQNSANALIIKGSRLLETQAFIEGEFAVQDESSMLCVETLKPEPGDTVLDLCAAPGGKTLYVGELMKNQGRIIACDLYEKKLGIVKRTAEKHGISNIECIPQDALKLNEDFLGIADKVICDVPCSGLGVIRRKPEIKYTRTLEDIKQLCKIQYAILENAGRYLKPGGTMVYSTCAVSHLENKGLIEYFMDKKGKGLYEIEEMKQLTPFENGTDGFFICKLVKI